MNFSGTVESVKSLFADTKKRTLLICALLVFMTACAVVVFSVSDGKKESSKKTSSEQRKIGADQRLLVPGGPAVPDEYVRSRKTEPSWSEGEMEEWFSFPDEGEVKKLAESNDKIVDDIIGAAP